jgi:hypothetical protein
MCLLGWDFAQEVEVEVAGSQGRRVLLEARRQSAVWGSLIPVDCATGSLDGRT